MLPAMSPVPLTSILRVALAAGLLVAAQRTPAADPVLAAAGDIACAPESGSFNGGSGTATECRMLATSDLLVARAPDVVLPLGDTQYEEGALARFQLSYHPTWGRVLATTRPVVGNHEYGTPGAAGYFDYFGAAAGDPVEGWYSFDVGVWHVVVLNSVCAAVGGCGVGSPQETWLRADLAAHPGACTVAAMHHPRFSSGMHGGDPAMSAFWDALHQAGADVVLTGHEHDYERFVPQRPDATADALHGLREFVVGTGGKDQRPFVTTEAGSEVRLTGTFGVLELTLHPATYEWKLVATDGSTADSGSGTCHRAPRPRQLHFVPPCRLVDTRLPDGPLGGPALQANVTRPFPLRGACGIPEGAETLVLNVTAVTPTATGSFRAGPSGPATDTTEVVSFRSNRTRAASFLGWLGNDGALAVTPVMATGTAHLVLDVAGYFE